MSKTKTPKKAKVSEGESTGAQSRGGFVGFSHSQIATFLPAAPGTYDTYRQIDKDPVIAFVQSIVKGPIIRNQYNYEKGWDDVPDEAVEFIKNAIDPIRHDIVRDCLMALNMSWAPFEKIWELDDDLHWVVKRLKPLIWDHTELIEGDNGIAGLRNMIPGKNPVDLPPIKCLYHINNVQPGFPYGIARNENARQVWSEAEQMRQKIAQYMKKISGVIVQLHYPEGTSKNASGADYANQWLAQSVLDGVSASYSVMFPNLYASVDVGKDPELASKLAGKSSWQLSTLDPGGTDYAPGMKIILEYWDTLKFEAWLRSARTGLESQHGSRADSKQHTDTAVLDAEQIDDSIANTLNKQCVDDMLELRYGPKMRGAVCIVPSPINDLQQQTLSDILKVILANATTAVAALGPVDVGAMYDILGIPLRDDAPGEIDWTKALGEPQPEQPEPKAPQPEPAAKNSNGKTNGKTQLSRVRPKINRNAARAILKAKGVDEDRIKRLMGP